MTARSRLLSFGAAGLVVVLGLIANPLLGGIAGEATSIALVAVGGIAIVSLAFLEVGLSEDRERARERLRERKTRPGSVRLPRRRRRPD